MKREIKKGKLRRTIESVSNPHVERLYVRFSGGEYTDITKDSTDHNCIIDENKLAKLKEKYPGKKYSVSHNHPVLDGPITRLLYKVIPRGWRWLSLQQQASPGGLDLSTFLSDSDAQTMTITVNGASSGRTYETGVIKKTPKTKNYPLGALMKNMLWYGQYRTNMKEMQQ